MAPELARKPTALVLMGALWPGNDASGPNISLTAMIEALADEFAFLRVARDRPVGDAAPLAASGRWLEAPGGAARYCPPGARGLAELAAILRETPHDLLLLNGFHDREFTIPALLMRRLGLAPRRPAILAPRGEFSAAALGLKPIRKAAYGALARSTGLLADVWLHATSAEEAEDMKATAACAGGCLVAPNIRALLAQPPHVAAADGMVRLCFLGRISRVKNLDLALRSLARVRAPIVFDIYGPIEDALHWDECRALIAALPPHIAATAHGAIANGATPQMLARHDLLFLPSRSENFGHAIFEALCCGVPALIGDATPWRGLEAAHAGWDLPLDAEAFARAIDAFAAMDEAGRARLRDGARALAERRNRESDAVAATRRMLGHALAEGSKCAA
jgi:glycosyltransferase involved in cell wall biosynthesis